MTPITPEQALEAHELMPEDHDDWHHDDDGIVLSEWFKTYEPVIRAALQSAAQPEPQAVREAGDGEAYKWLIERNSTLWGPEWFCAGKDRYTKDANKAIHFPDKESAEETHKFYRPDLPAYPCIDKGEEWDYHFSITEHGWMTPAPEPAEGGGGGEITNKANEAISLIDRALQDAVNVLGTEACFHDGRCQALQQVRLILKEIAPRPAKAGDKVASQNPPILADKAACSAEVRDNGVAGVPHRMTSWARFICMHNETRFYGDHACKQCFPHSELLTEGFKCAYHDALDYLAASPAAMEKEGEG